LSGKAPTAIDRLKDAAQAIMQALSPDREASSLKREVESAASAYRARLTAMAEAKTAPPTTIRL
jgi:hypothetical protein